MANRAYLYSADQELSRLRDLSESRTPISLIYKIILGIDTEITNSKIWNYEYPLAIKGNFQKGLERLYNFYDFLKNQSDFSSEKIDSYKKVTQSFFEKHEDRRGEYFFLEAGEIFDLMADLEPIENQNKMLYKEICDISDDINTILSEKPSSIFEFKDTHWLNKLKKNHQLIEPYWAQVSYFSFNQTK